MSDVACREERNVVRVVVRVVRFRFEGKCGRFVKGESLFEEARVSEEEVVLTKGSCHVSVKNFEDSIDG